MLHFVFVSYLEVAFVHGFVALVVISMCAIACSTARAMLECTVYPNLFLPYDFDGLPGSVCYAAIGPHLVEWKNIMCFLP